ncbi:MAG: hypothetical protein FWB75_02115 [Oscillospiraceae bacterium]|nr:hypothetical protein [Oscillospiraceae bacterium]
MKKLKTLFSGIEFVDFMTWAVKLRLGLRVNHLRLPPPLFGGWFAELGG